MGMRKLLLIISILFSTAMVAQSPMHKLIRKKAASGSYPDTVAKFFFTKSGSDVSGWVRMNGDPLTSVLTGTTNGITVSTVATGDSYWNDNGVTESSGYVAGSGANLMFPGMVNSGWYFHALGAPTAPNMSISGLNPSGTYEIYISSNREGASDNRLTKISVVDSVGTTARTSINSAPSSNASGADYNQSSSNGTVIWFTGRRPKSTGIIELIIERHNSSWTYGYINGLVIVRTS